MAVTLFLVDIYLEKFSAKNILDTINKFGYHSNLNSHRVVAIQGAIEILYN